MRDGEKGESVTGYHVDTLTPLSSGTLPTQTPHLNYWQCLVVADVRWGHGHSKAPVDVVRQTLPCRAFRPPKSGGVADGTPGKPSALLAWERL